MEKILSFPDLKGGTFNRPDGKVEVKVEGKKEDIVKLREEIISEIGRKKDNPGIEAEVGKIEYDDSLEIPDAMHSSQSLQWGQMSKFVDVGLDMKTSLIAGFTGLGVLLTLLIVVNFIA